jgi:hypothetical protein
MPRRRALGLLAAGALRGYSAPPPFEFSSYLWEAKHNDRRLGPGPNYFHRENVELDAEGCLHLKVLERDGHWSCAEVIGARSLGYGTYEFETGDTSTLDVNVVLGLFTWDTAAPEHHNREIDVEIGRWSRPDYPNAQYVVQPYTRPENIVRFELAPGPAIHSFLWSPGRVVCRSVQRGSVVREHAFTSGVPPAGGEHPRINLWLFNGLPPVGGRPAEVVIRRFGFRAE